MAGLAQRHRCWGCLLVLPPENSNVHLGSVPCASVSPAPKMRMSGDSSQAERGNLESCCSGSSAHGTARTEAQRLGLLSCLATSNCKHCSKCPCWAPLVALFPKGAHLEIARRQKDVTWKAVAQPHLAVALLAQRHRDWGCLLVLPPQTSNVALGDRVGHLRHACSQIANVYR